MCVSTILPIKGFELNVMWNFAADQLEHQLSGSTVVYQ
jgi:hypothetical protein